MFSDYFDVPKRVFKSGEAFEVSIKARYFQMDFRNLRKTGPLYLEWMPDDSVKMSGDVTLRQNGDITGWERIDIPNDDSDTFRFTLPPMLEGPVVCKLFHQFDAEKPAKLLCMFNLYVLDKDLYSLRPYKGDCHVHTSYSVCGDRQEDPHFVVAVGRQKGMDFMAVTDHCQIEGSESVLDFPASVGSDFKVFRGEECHMLAKHVESRFCVNPFRPWNHIVNFGGRDGVAKYMNDHYDEYLTAIHAAADKMDQSLSENMRLAMAGSDWIFDKIHEYGGVAVFAHPFWHAGGKLNLPKPVREYILKQAKFDVIEMPGLAGLANRSLDEDNVLCTAWWQEACIKAGRTLPVIGNTDSHHSRDVLGMNFSIVFSKDDCFDSIATAFKSGNAVGVSYRDGKDLSPRLWGSFRLVRYAQFLMREYFPEHDELCQAEGNMMLSALRGHLSKEVISGFAKQLTQKCLERFF
ncbi:MAG: PHP domain-containing protein [Victivallales bacterium]|nr:PHP domain-containing protein [Victivallales bacterium]